MDNSLRSSIIDLLALYDYSFVTENNAGPETLIFQRRTGPHISREVITAHKDDRRVMNLAKQYQQAGFSCKVRYLTSLLDLDADMFSEFFALAMYKKRMNDLYKHFAARVENSTGLPYTYKNPRFKKIDLELTEKPCASTDLITEIKCALEGPGATLIVIEAAAGFGKTCTAYELTRALAASPHGPLPLLSELSMNRMAAAFKYVLLEELDRNFRFVHASFDLVEHQIQEGRLVVILDGFDELLHSGKEEPRYEGASPFERAEPMLATIRQLLQGEASVVLTTRKTSLLTDHDFFQWLKKNEGDFVTTRFVIEQPSPEDWVSPTRLKELKDSGFPVENVANPVLYAFISSLGERDFERCCADPEVMIGEYFSVLLRREQQRQDLLMTVLEQKWVLLSVAAEMAANDFTAETRGYFEAFFKSQHRELLEKVRSRYKSESRQSVSAIVEKLLHHAMLDRSSEQKGLLGFTNDFILGTLVADKLVLEKPRGWLGPEFFVESSVFAYELRNEERRQDLWEVLLFQAEILPDNLALRVDLALRGKVLQDFEKRTFREIVFEGHSLGEGSMLIGCSFVDCEFRAVAFFPAQLRDIIFIGCRFYDCVIDESGFDGEAWVVGLYGCRANTTEFLDMLESMSEKRAEVEPGDEEEKDSVEFERRVLERFWPPGRAHAGSRRAVRTLYMGSEDREYRYIGQAIERLQKRGLIDVKSDSATLVHSRMAEIRNVLNR